MIEWGVQEDHLSKAKFEAARKLIKAGRYSQARSLLETIDHPKAAEWIVKLDQLARRDSQPQRPQPGTSSKTSTQTTPATRARPSSKRRTGLNETVDPRRETATQRTVAPAGRPSSKPATQPKSPPSQPRKPASQSKRKDDSPRRGASIGRVVLLLVFLVVVIGGGVFIALNAGLFGDDEAEPIVAAVATESEAELTPEASDEGESETGDAEPTPVPDNTDTEDNTAVLPTATEVPPTATLPPPTPTSRPPSATPPPPTAAVVDPIPMEQTLLIAQQYARTEGIVSVEALNVQANSQIDIDALYQVISFLTVDTGYNIQETADVLLDATAEILATRDFNFVLTLNDEVSTQEYTWSGSEQSWTGTDIIPLNRIKDNLSNIQGVNSVDDLVIIPDASGVVDYRITADVTIANAQEFQQKANQIRNRLQDQLETESINITLLLVKPNGEERRLNWSVETGSWN